MTRPVLVGGYTADGGGSALGIGLLELAPDGGLEWRGALVESASPSFLAVRGDLVLATAEHAGTIDSFRLVDGGLVSVRRERTAGAAPCHVAIQGDHAVVSCYGDGVVSVHPLDVDGAGPVQLALPPVPGAGRPNRDGPHAHAALVLDDARVLTTDLGTDLLHLLERRDGVLARTRSITVPAGSGPRHLARHPNGHVLVITEIGNEVLVLDPALDLVGSASLGPRDGQTASEIAVSADGRFVYAGVRGRDVVVVLESSSTGGSLHPVAEISTRGSGPRHLALLGDPTLGDRLLVANQNSHSVESFAIGADGLPVHVGSARVPSPTCLLPLPAGRFGRARELDRLS